MTRVPLVCLSAALAVTIVGYRPATAPPPGDGGALDVVGALGRPVEVAGIGFTAGQLVALMLTATALALLAVSDRRPRRQPISPAMGFGLFRPGERAGEGLPPLRIPGSAGESTDLRPLLEHLLHEAGVTGLLSGACLVVPLAMVQGTSAADPARYPGRIWESGYPYVLGGSALLLVAAVLYAIRRASLRRRHGRLALALAGPLDREALEIEVMDVEERVIRQRGARGWPLVALATVLYALAAAGPFVPALSVLWPPWSALAGGPAPPGPR
jgi:hypothetical protein